MVKLNTKGLLEMLYVSPLFSMFFIPVPATDEAKVAALAIIFIWGLAIIAAVPALNVAIRSIEKNGS